MELLGLIGRILEVLEAIFHWDPEPVETLAAAVEGILDDSTQPLASELTGILKLEAEDGAA